MSEVCDCVHKKRAVYSQFALFPQECNGRHFAPARLFKPAVCEYQFGRQRVRHTFSRVYFYFLSHKDDLNVPLKFAASSRNDANSFSAPAVCVNSTVLILEAVSSTDAFARGFRYSRHKSTVRNIFLWEGGSSTSTLFSELFWSQRTKHAYFRKGFSPGGDFRWFWRTSQMTQVRLSI